LTNCPRQQIPIGSSINGRSPADGPSCRFVFLGPQIDTQHDRLSRKSIQKSLLQQMNTGPTLPPGTADHVERHRSMPQPDSLRRRGDARLFRNSRSSMKHFAQLHRDPRHHFDVSSVVSQKLAVTTPVTVKGTAPRRDGLGTIEALLPTRRVTTRRGALRIQRKRREHTTPWMLAKTVLSSIRQHSRCHRRVEWGMP
jgi:hypothetical protein